MRKRFMMKKGVYLALVFVFSVAAGGSSWAQEGICVFPTGTEEVTYSPNWTGSTLTVYVSDDKVSRGNSVLLWVESNGHGCTPYHWQVTGKGFHFDSASGPTTAVTAGDGEPAYIWADTTACGAGFITVTDGCGGRVEASFRVPDAGKWVFLSRQVCGEIAEPGVRGHCCERCSRIAVGAYRYTDCWVGGPYPCRYKSQTCSKWPYTEDLSELCYHVGYHPCFSLQGLYDHNLEIFQCADQ